MTVEQAQETVNLIRKQIQSYFREHGLSYAIFGPSGGLDSSVIAGLFSELEGIKPVEIIMLCESNIEVG